MALAEYRLFFSQFRQRFHTTGAIVPSGPALARAITSPLRDACRGPLRVLEVGPGTGVFTRAILDQLHPGDCLDLCEINPAFEPPLEACLAAAGAQRRNLTCRIHICPVNDIPARADYDFVVSGLPLNNFAASEVDAILRHLLAALRPGGVLSYFEYIYIRELKRALVTSATERTRLSAVAATVEDILSPCMQRRTAVFANLPPAWARHVTRPQ